MKNKGFKAYRELDKLFKKKEISTEEEIEQGEIKTIYSEQVVHTDENLFEEDDDYEDEEYMDEEDEMGLEIESLIQKEKTPSFLDRMKNIQEESKEEKKPIQVSVKIQQLKDKKALIEEKEEVETNEESVSDLDLVEAFKGLEKLSHEDLLKKCKEFMILDYKMLSYLDEQEAIIEKQKSLIADYEKKNKTL